MLKKYFSKTGLLLVALITVVVLAACGGSSDDSGSGTDDADSASTDTDSASSDSGDETYTIDFTAVASDSSPQHMGQEKFKELVEERSEGRITVELFPNGQLYSSEVEAYEAVQAGNVEMTMGASEALAGIDKNFSAAGFPFLFEDEAAAHEALDGELGQALFASLEENGIKGLKFAEAGMRHITNNQRKIESVEDINGLLTRTLENPLHIAIFEALGANASPYAYGELYGALQQNTFHAQDNPIINTRDMRFYEVQDYLTLSGHMYTSLPVVINLDFFNSLPEDLQTILVEAADEAYDYQREVAGAEVAEAIELMEDELEVNTLSDEARQELAEAVEVVYEQFGSEIDADIMDIINSIRQ